MSFAEGVGDGKEIPAVESCCIGSGGAWSFVVGYEGNFILSVSVGAVPSVDVWTAAWHVHNFVYIYRGIIDLHSQNVVSFPQSLRPSLQFRAPTCVCV